MLNLKTKILILTVLVLMLSGCYDRVEMDDRNYIITLGIDKYEYKSEIESEKNNLEKRYNLSMGEANIEGKAEATGDKSEKKDQNNIEIISGTTIGQALRTSDKYNSKAAYYGQLKTVILGEELMKDKKLFKAAIEELKNDKEVNDSVLILGCKGDAGKVMKAVLNKNTSAGLYIWDFYKSSGKEIASKMVNIQKFTKEMQENQSTCIPMIYLENENIVIDGSVVIEDYSLKCFLEGERQRGLDWINGGGKTHIVEVFTDEEYIGAKILKNKRNLSFRETNSGTQCQIDINIDAEIEDKSDIIDGTDNIEIKLAEEIKKEMNLIIDDYYVYKTDFMQFGKKLKSQDYKLYEKCSGVIDEFKINVKVNIKE